MNKNSKEKKMKIEKKEKKIRKFVVAGDFHFPQTNPQALAILLKFLKNFKTDYFIFGGDQLDMDIVSHWEVENHRLKEGKRLKKIYQDFDRQILTPIEKTLPKKCIKVWLDGNHEYFLEQYLDKYPEVEGLIEPEEILKLKERKWERLAFSPQEDPRSVYHLGRKLFVSHGFWTNKYFTSKTVDATSRSIIVFHKHTFQAHTKETLIDQSDFHTCYGIPCMCEMNPSYGKNRPNNWVKGFAFGYLRQEDNFNVYPVIIAKGEAVIEGKLYRER